MDNNSAEILHTILKTKHPQDYEVFVKYTGALAERTDKEIFMPASKAYYQADVILAVLRKAHEIARQMNDEGLSFNTGMAATYAAYIRPDDVAKRLNEKLDPTEVSKATRESEEIRKSFPYLVELEEEARAKGLIKNN